MTSETPVTATETVAVAGLYRGIQATFTYLNTASTASGMGVQVGTGVQWKQSTLATRTSSMTGTYVVQTGSNTAWSYREWRANWQHLRYWRHCPLTPEPGYRTERFTEPYKVNGFPATITSRYPDVPCASRNVLTGVSSVETEQTTGMRYDLAFSITWGSASFNGSAKSDWGNTVKMKFTKPSSLPGYWYWCGNQLVAQDSQWVKAGR